jgi:hypothetical protein
MRRFVPIAVTVLLLSFSGLSLLAEDSASGPRAGKYRIMTYGATSSPPLFLGYFVLAGNTYKAYLPGDKLSGEGRWQYDPGTHTVTWSSGPYAGVWGGEFTVEREGKTHKIRLKRNTIATNSTESN